jgi:hypothetical protein
MCPISFPGKKNMGAMRVRRANPKLIISHWCKLIENLSASPTAFYARLRQVIAERKIPNLEEGTVEWKEGGLLSAKRQYFRLVRERMTIDVCAAPFGTGFFVSWRLGEVPLTLNVLGLLILLGGFTLAGQWAFLEYRFQLQLYRPQNIAAAVAIVLCVVFAILGVMRCAVAAGLANLDAVLLHTPVIAGFYERFLRPMTYYRIDVALMYEQAVHAAVMQVIDEMTDNQGIPRLAESERKPILRDFYKR